jgi:hypothetical protein
MRNFCVKRDIRFHVKKYLKKFIIKNCSFGSLYFHEDLEYVRIINCEACTVINKKGIGELHAIGSSITVRNSNQWFYHEIKRNYDIHFLSVELSIAYITQRCPIYDLISKIT